MSLLFLVLFLFTSVPDTQLAQQSKSQAKHYILQIEKDRQIEENLWALTTLATSKKEVRYFVEQEIRNNDYTNDLLTLFKEIEDSYEKQLEKVTFKTGSSNLLVALLLSINNQERKRILYRKFQSSFSHPDVQGINYKNLCKSIVKQEKLSVTSLTSDQFYLPHFFLLYYDKDLTSLSRDYLKKIAESFQINSQSEKKLFSILRKASVLRVHYLLDQYTKIDPLFNQLNKKSHFPISTIKLNLYRYLDYSMYSLGYYDRSLEIVRQFTLPLSEFLDKHDQKLSIKLSKGVYLYSIGKIKAAQKIYQDLLNKVDKNDPEIKLSSLYNNLALSYYKLGRFDKYLGLQLQALERAERAGNYAHQLNVYKNLFVYYQQNNDSDNALLYIEKAQKLAKERNRTEELGRIYTLHGSFYVSFRKNYQLAHKYFLKAENYLDPQNNAKYYIDLLQDQAKAFEKQKQYNRALQKYDQIIDTSPKGNNPNHLYALVYKASVFLKTDQTEKSKKLIDQFKSLNLDQLAFQEVIKAKKVEANYLQRIGKPKQALDILEPALDQIVVRAQSSADLKSGFWHVEEEYLEAFELAVSIYNTNGQPEKAIETLDQLKTINDASLYQNPLVKSSLLDESELTQYKQLTNQLDATRKKLLTVPENRRADLQHTISQLKLKKRKLDRKLTKQIDSDPISIREVQNKLSARELVMHITELNNQYYIAQISRSDVTMNTISLDSTRRILLSNSVQQVASNETNLDSLYKISGLLNLEEIPDRIEQVTLIPDSYFYQLPIDILPLEKPTHSYSYGQVTYVIEKFKTQYLTSLDDFKPDSDPVSRSRNKLSYTGYGVSNFSGYGDESLVPLPHAETEVTNIAKRLTHLASVKTYINQQSTKPTFTQTAPQSQIIHLATHSEVSERDPMFSTVYLSKDTNEADSTFEDRLFAYELFELDLSNDMIMLNSCESGSGSYIQGTGVMGISRALQYAGARSLVLNLWSVNDKLASDFATHFYDQLNQGKSKTEALRDTKRYFLHTKNASPHFWGPYMLIGNADPIVKPNQDKNMAMAGAFIIYFLLMVGLSYLTQQGLIFRPKEETAA